MKSFDKEAQYKDRLAEKIREIKIICNELAIPFVFSACIKSDKDGCEYVNEMLSPDFLQLEVNDNRFIHYMNVMNGFMTIPPRNQDLDIVDYD